ncbi:MAG: hypothetical protein ACRCV6_01045 [Formosimonas sp.]
MPRRRSFPSPDDRSVNQPSIIIESSDVLGYYIQETQDDKERVVESVKSWYVKKAKELGWNSAEFHGNQCILTAKIERK